MPAAEKAREAIAAWVSERWPPVKAKQRANVTAAAAALRMNQPTLQRYLAGTNGKAGPSQQLLAAIERIDRPFATRLRLGQFGAPETASARYPNRRQAIGILMARGAATGEWEPADVADLAPSSMIHDGPGESEDYPLWQWLRVVEARLVEFTERGELGEEVIWDGDEEDEAPVQTVTVLDAELSPYPNRQTAIDHLLDAGRITETEAKELALSRFSIRQDLSVLDWVDELTIEVRRRHREAAGLDTGNVPLGDDEL